MPDHFAGFADSPTAPSRRVAPIAPDDGADLPETPKGIYIGTGGDLTLVPIDAGTGAGAVTFRNLPSGSLLPVRARRVLATGTTAADLLVLL